MADSGQLLAEGSTLLIDVPSDALDVARLDELGWKIYPD
jgi:hypothetical protein